MSADVTNGGRDCAKGHGYLARNCPTCAREAETDALQSNLTNARALLERAAVGLEMVATLHQHGCDVEDRQLTAYRALAAEIGEALK